MGYSGSHTANTLKLNLGGNGDEQSRIEVFCNIGEASAVVPLPDNAATTEQVEELQVCIRRLE